MKKVVKANYMNVPGGYRYILKHGIGPGTLPKDVNIVKYGEDRDDWLTEVWLDRALSKEELEKYDIPSETTLTSATESDKKVYPRKYDINGNEITKDDIEDFKYHVEDILSDVYENWDNDYDKPYYRSVLSEVEDTIQLLIDEGEYEDEEMVVPKYWHKYVRSIVNDEYADYDWSKYFN